MNVQGTSGMQQITQLLMSRSQGGGPPSQGAIPGGPPSQLTSIKNDQGQSVLDIRGELQSSVEEAISGFDGSGDLRSTIQGAIESTLEENGFDPQELKTAMKDSGFSPMGGFMGGGDPFGRALGGGFDPSALTQGSQTGEDLISTLLAQLRSGSVVDESA